MKITTIISATFGKGTVVSEDLKAKTITVDFNGTIKTLITRFANLTNEDGSVYESQKVKKATSKKTDYSKLSDEELTNLYNEEKAKFTGALISANNDVKEDHLKGIGHISK